MAARRFAATAQLRLPAATTNQTRTAKGETKEKKSPTARKRTQADMRAAARKGARATAMQTTKRRT